MNITEKLTNARNKITGKGQNGSDPAALHQRIAAQVTAIRDLEAEHARASLAWAAGASGSAAQLDTLDAQLSTARRDLRALTAALQLADENERLAEQARRAALAATQINALRQHFAARDRAAEELSAAIGAAVAAYRRLVQRSEKARRACPIGMQWPLGSPHSVGEIKRLVEQELFRVGGDPTLSGRLSFPGAQAHDLRVLNEPDKLEPLVVALKRWSSWTLGEFLGRPLPQPVQQPEPPDPAQPEPLDPAQPDPAQPAPESWEADPADLLPGTVDARQAAISTVKMK